MNSSSGEKIFFVTVNMLQRIEGHNSDKNCGLMNALQHYSINVAYGKLF